MAAAGCRMSERESSSGDILGPGIIVSGWLGRTITTPVRGFVPKIDSPAFRDQMATDQRCNAEFRPSGSTATISPCQFIGPIWERINEEFFLSSLSCRVEKIV
jgi:hypothetical protein